MKACPCGSGRDYSECCEPIVSGRAKAPTAEALMRARYSAYATGAVGFILESCVKGEEDRIDETATREWSEGSKWLGLTIHGTSQGGPGDSEGVVEFTATYEQDGLRHEHRERSRFVRKDGAWLFDSGEVVPTTVVRSGEKVGRNDPCPCGSGKKYKKCCGSGA